MRACGEVRWKILILILLSLSLPLASGCSGPSPGIDLSGTSWELVSYRNEIGMQDVIAGTSITANFGEDRSLSGSAGCNYYSGSCTARDHAFTLSEIVWTEMYCLTPDGVMRQETEYLAVLQKAMRFDVTGEELMLEAEDGTVLLWYNARK